MSALLKKLNTENFSIILILALVFSRLIPHPPNFTPIIAIAIIGNHFLKNINVTFLVILSSMILSDFILGLHKTIFFTYLSLIIIIFIMSKLDKKISSRNLVAFSLGGSLLFYLISNLGVWILSDVYEKNLIGLFNCYVLALPFLKNSILSTIFFSYLSYWSHIRFVDFKKIGVKV